MISVKKFSFNLFQTNTYIVWDESKECAIIDAACEDQEEKTELETFISRQGLVPVRLIYTHCHVDHTLGNSFVTHRYQLEPEVHPRGKLFWETAREFSSFFGVRFDEPMNPRKFLEEGDEVRFGRSLLRVLYTPGHADGSICLHCPEQKFVMVGDVLFYGSIGRTDLPTGNFQVLRQSILTKLFTLEDDTVVYPGHGPETTIGHEKRHNPYLNLE
jgi:hydroxyacylglutathione hydrolase